MATKIEKIAEETMTEINQHFPEEEDLAWHFAIAIQNCSYSLFEQGS